MTTITLTVTGTKAQAAVSGPLTSGMVGLPVNIAYDEAWNGLTKNLVCRCGKWGPGEGETRTVLNVDQTAVVAHEVMQADMFLYLGIEGYSADGKLVMPTTWASCGKIQPGANAGEDPTGDPGIPLWAQLQAEIGKLKGSAVTETQIQEIIGAYLEEHAGEIPGSSQNGAGEPGEGDIPRVFITGTKPTTKSDVQAEMRYISGTDNFHAYLTIKCQGTSSMAYAKKNYTVKLYSDEARETKLKKSFKDWNHSGNKYVLKANWIDHSHARNIVSARLWNQVVESRPDYDSLPAEMRSSPRNGAVDGFPVKVYYNGTYEGIYTWNIGKDDWMWGMDEDNANHVLMCAETNNNGAATNTPCNFRALWSGVNEQHWSVEVGTNSTALKTSLNNLIQFVMNNDGDAFRNGIGTYLDIQSAIDYYIFQYEICGLDGLAKNMLLATYDGVKWICGAYDLDATFGLWWDGSKFVSAQYRCPEDYQETYSLLWERIEANYADELKARQAQLRAGVLSFSNMVTHFERFMEKIGNDLYGENLTVYTAIPSSETNNIQQIRSYIRDRQAYVDAEFAALTGSDSGGSGETEVTMTGISATYMGGAVPVGTAVTDLTGIGVVAYYSDGSSEAVTDYTLVGKIVEGENIISVRYGGKVTTFTVTGVADPEITLTSISVTYTGGDVTAGTAVTDLTGIAVTAEYSDGSTETVTGYTLSGEIVEGANTITVTYGGMTATFTVNGISAEATSLTLDKTAVAVTDAYYVVLTAATTPASAASGVVWTSDNGEVATVEDGIVRILANGTAKITAAVGEHSASCDITVTDPEISYTWSETAEYGLGTSGEEVSGDKHVTGFFTAPYGNYRIRNNNAQTYYGSIRTYSSDETYVHGNPGWGQADVVIQTGEAGAYAVVAEGIDNVKMRMSAYVGTTGTLDNVVLERNRGVWSEIDIGNISSSTGAVSYGGSYPSYISLVRIPVIGGGTYQLSNKDGGAFTYKAIAEYKADGTFLRFTQDAGVTDPLNVILNSETAFVRLLAAYGTEPNAYLEFTRTA